jgi:hypothetical protein
LKNNVGAVYCIYDNSGFLEESIARVYPAVEKVLVLLNVVTWAGQIDYNILKETYGTLLNIPDPEHKIDVITQYWSNEATQRNFGTKYLEDHGIEWAMEVDDDELYNTEELKKVFGSLNLDDFSAYLFGHQLYWKNRDTIIDCNPMYFPTILSTKAGRVYFHTARMITVFEGKAWFTVHPSVLMCHHMSYVRSDEKMLRKIQSFSHASDIVKTWYEEVWLKWDENMEDLHPQNPKEFKKTIKAETSAYKLI